MLYKNSFFLKNYLFFDKSLFFIFNNFFKNNFFNNFSKNYFYTIFSKNNFLFYKYINFFFFLTTNFFNNCNFTKFNNYNLNKFKNIYSINNVYIFLINTNIFIKIYKNIINMLYLNFFNKKFSIFLNVTDLFHEMTTMNFMLHNYNFINIFNNLFSLFSKKKITRNYLVVTLNKLIFKYKINSIVVVDNIFTSFYYNIIRGINLPVISYSLPNFYNNIIDYPIFVNHITLFHKYFFFCEIYNIYFIARYNLLKYKLILYFYYINLFLI